MKARHIVLVGVASVGKTTMGREASERLGLPFADNEEEALEAAGGTDIDAMLRKHGDKGWNRVLFAVYQSLLILKERHIIAASPRLYDRRGFWTGTSKKAVSIHLVSSPLEVLMRDLKSQGIDTKITAAMKKDYLWYYEWRFEHCRKADLELHLKASLHQDVDSLCDLIKGMDER
jgi:shikimate kinase